MRFEFRFESLESILVLILFVYKLMIGISKNSTENSYTISEKMLNRNPKWLSAEVFSSAQKQPKQNASSQNREENGSTTLRNTREKPLLAG